MFSKSLLKVVSYTDTALAAESDDAYYDIIADMRTGINEVIDTLRAFEDYFEDKEALRQAVEGDFDRMEKITFELKNLTKKLSRKKVVRR